MRPICGSFSLASLLVASAVVLISALPTTADAAVLFSESWESASLAEGGSVSLPTGLLSSWTEEPFAQNATVLRPGSAAQGTEWNATEPFDSPADLNHLLVLADGGTQDNGVFAVLPVQIAPNTVYSFTAAIGFQIGEADAGEWSMQLWADTNNNGFLDRASGDTFIAQTCPPVIACPGVDPAEGEWMDNQIQFDSIDYPELVGSSLIVFVNNFATPNVSSSPVFIDNLRLETVPQPVPALGRLGMLGLLIVLATIGIGAARAARSTDS